MAKKEPKFYILCLSNCYFKSILIAKERNGKYLKPPYFTDIAGHRAVLSRCKLQTIAKIVAEDVLTVVS